jgi:ABC-type Fe3+ transport system substrate-binding protein
MSEKVGRRRALRLLGTGALWGMGLAQLATACAPAAPQAAPTAAPKPAPTAAPAAGAAPQAPAQAAPVVAQAAPESSADWQETWGAWVTAAKKEGTVAVVSQPADAFRSAIMAFQKEYPDIQVQYTGLTGANFYPKYWTELAGGQSLYDARIGGAGGEAFQARDKGELLPLNDILILPEVKDPNLWFGGADAMYDDEGKQYLFSFQCYVAYGVYVNSDVVSSDQFSKVSQLLDPQWKGKISAQDPKGAAGAAHFSVWLHTFGEDFMRQLYTTQGVVVYNDPRQQVEQLIRGVYPIGIAASDAVITDFHHQGVGLSSDKIHDTGTLSTGNGELQLFANPPHPNAAKVFGNWILQKKVQESFSESTQTNSRRLDVTPFDPSTAPDPALLGTYVANQVEAFLPERQRGLALAKELVP